MTDRTKFFLFASLFAVVSCSNTGTPNNSEGVSALDANTSAFRGGASIANAGDAVTNTGTGVTGGNGQKTVARMSGNSGEAGGGGAQSSGPAPSGPGAR
jgi:hypothetical protein